MTDSAPITRAALVARPSLAAALATLVEAAGWLDAHGCTPVLEWASADAAGVADRWPTAARDDLAAAADVVIAFGGDGTLLDAARAVAHAAIDVPLIGINLGRLGFLTDVGRADMTAALEAMLAGRTEVESRLLIEGFVQRDGGAPMRGLALNDVVITRGALSRMVEMTVTVDGRFVCFVKADGLIVATPTGSTAYTLSAGGPIVHPALDAVVLTPIAPHTLTHRPLVLPAGAHIEIQPVEASAVELVATFDGQQLVPLAPGQAVRIGPAARRLRLLRTSGRTHFDMLREKLKWGNG